MRSATSVAAFAVTSTFSVGAQRFERPSQCIRPQPHVGTRRNAYTAMHLPLLPPHPLPSPFPLASPSAKAQLCKTDALQQPTTDLQRFQDGIPAWQVATKGDIGPFTNVDVEFTALLAAIIGGSLVAGLIVFVIVRF